METPQRVLDPPVVLYSPQGASRKITDPLLETTLAKTGWRREPYPPVMADERLDHGAQIEALGSIMADALAKLEARIEALEKKQKGK